MKKREDDALQKVLAILEEEGKTFEEKKKAAICYLEEKEDSLLANVLISKAEEDAAGLLWKKQFWKQGEALEEKMVYCCARQIDEIRRTFSNCRRKILYPEQL